MAEDESLVRAIEESGLTFIGPARAPCAGRTQRRSKANSTSDQRLGRSGVDDLTVRTLLAKAEREEAGST